ncbi:ATP-binding protein [Sediminicoccus sp. KRV36]|uniref:ATP-binding protein n=1 Tax=Sediminicoccus sp. KRV36 TaxID=3133721 RepID=UPI002010C624|nr:ATP-binding protein [Sediminicoccus rosea]UPY37379.1 ATP-binding protein [Sediminicoccus rosea]
MNPRSIELRADFAELPRLAEWAERQARDLALDARSLYAIQLCLEEVVANLVMHAQPATEAGTTITVRIEGAPLRVTVEDDAIAFDPTRLAPAEAPAALEHASIGGLGLGLVRGFSSRCDYASGAGRNRLVMEFAA